MRLFALLVEPADYSFVTIKNVYNQRNVDYAFIKSKSEAGRHAIQSLDSMCFLHRILLFFRVLNQYDGFVCNSYSEPIAFELILLNVFFFKKPIAFESDTELQVPSGFLKRFMKAVVLKFLFTRKYCYGFPAGRFEHEKLYLHYGMARDRIIMMPMVTESKLLSAHADLTGNIFRFGYVGRLIALKQIDRIIEAFSRIQSIKNVEFMLVGDGDEREKLEKMSLGLPIKFMGALFGEEKDKAMASMDALILNSTHDQWGYVVNEALTLGVPVIVSDGVGCRHELVEECDGRGPTGLVVNKYNMEELAGAMTKICTDKELWQTLHNNALKRMEYWNYNLYAKQFDKWVERIGA